MKARRINSNKPYLWKADIAASVDQFNQWFMRFAPEAFRSTRVKTTEHVKAALVATNDLRTVNPAMLKANPGALPTLRMCTAPPLAVDRQAFAVRLTGYEASEEAVMPIRIRSRDTLPDRT